MEPEDGARSVNAVIAVAQRLRFYRALQLGLDGWLSTHPGGIGLYRASMAQVDGARIALEALLEALSRGIVPLSPPRAEEVERLKDAVLRLTARIEAARALEDLMAVMADAGTALADAREVTG